VTESKVLHRRAAAGKREITSIMTEESFKDFIERWIDRYGTAQALADAIDMSLSAFSRGVRNAGTLGVESLLRLAEQTGEDPSKVLRIAGKGDVARLIEQLYGRHSQFIRPSRKERDFLALWNALGTDAQKPLMALIDRLSADNSKGLRRR
jgi:hypothetical protein